jgi:hypothetical protein
MRKLPGFPHLLRHSALWIIAAAQVATLAACGGGGYGGGGSNMPVAGVGPSKLFAGDSTDKVVGSLANPDPGTGFLTVDRTIGGPNFNYANFSHNIGSLALDATRDTLYVGNGTSVLVFHSASVANGDIFASASFGTIGNTGSMFVDTTNDRLYVGDDVTDVKVFSMASTDTPTLRHITGVTTPIHGVAVDTTTKNILYVSNDTAGAPATHQIMVFDSADSVTTAGPNRTITPTVASTNVAVGGISLDAGNDRLYVAGGSASTTVMVFNTASTATGAIAPDKTLSGFPSAVLNVVVDPLNDRLYAVGSNGHIYLVETVSTLGSGAVTAKDASLSNGGALTAVAVAP